MYRRNLIAGWSHPHVLEFAERVRGHWSQDSKPSARMLHLMAKLLRSLLDPVANDKY